MQKKLLLFLVCFLVYFIGQAQMSFIPKAGVSLANIVFENNSDDKILKTGLIVGAGINIPVGDNFFSIQPELLYIQKGQAVKDNAIDLKYKETLNYIELPILAKVSFGSESFKAYVNAGPSIGFSLGGKYKFSGDAADDMLGTLLFRLEDDITFGDSIDDYYENSFDLGAQFGGGLGLQAGPGTLLLDLRYGLGFSNLYKTGNGMDKEDAKSKHRVIAITLGYAVPFGGK